VLGQLRLGSLADEMVDELERERAEAAAQAAEREHTMRGLRREIANGEANLDNLLLAEVVNPDRIATLERTLGRKRADLAALAAPEPVAPVQRRLDAHQAASVRALLDNLAAAWPTMDGAERNDVIALVLERVE